MARRNIQNPLKKKYVTVTAKMDGENTTMYREWIHARSIERLKRHESTSWVKVKWEMVRHQISEQERVKILDREVCDETKKTPGYAHIRGTHISNDTCLLK